jgi:hypothetical protein
VTPRVCFAILAHNNRPCLEDLRLNLRVAAPEADVVVFNSGTDLDLTGFDADVCPTSSPLVYNGIVRVPTHIMRWLVETDRVPDYLVTLEPDMMLMRRGFPDFLGKVMGDSAYMGTRYHEVPSGWWENPIGKRARWKWSEGWRDLIGTPGPSHSFGPGQIFGREYINKLVALPHLDKIIERAEATRLSAIEEIIYPSLAAAMDCRPIPNPGSDALTLRWYPPHELRRFLTDESAFLVHRVSTDPEAADRRLIHDWLDGRTEGRQYDSRHVPGLWHKTKIIAERYQRRRWLDIKTVLLPEVPGERSRASSNGTARDGD